MISELKWYDSRWLETYLAAKEIVRQTAPAKFAEFEERLSIFRTSPSFKYMKLDDFFNEKFREEIKSTIRSIPKEKFEIHELQNFGRFVVHDFAPFTNLQNDLTDRVSELVGEPVEASYNFLSMYTKMGKCEPHLDAPSAKYTLDVCIDQSEPWPIHFSQITPWPDEKGSLGRNWQSEIKSHAGLNFKAETLMPGDAILFSGSSQWHYRDPLPAKGSNSFCDLLFFHFMPRGCAEIIQPRNWAAMFNIPELSSLPNIDDRM
jgi:hypothetical protein